jgi:hypothetical protein
VSSLLAVELAGDQLHALRLEGGPGKVNIRKSFSAKFPKPLTTAHANELGAWLRKELNDHGLGTGDVVACMGRGQTTFRQLEIPDVPAAEVTAVVHLTVNAEEDSSGNQVVDYDLGPVERGQRFVTVALAPEKTVDALRECLKAAGLNPVRLTVRPYAIKFLRDRLLPQTDTQHASMLLAPSPDGFDISIWDRHRLEIARTIYPNGAAPHENAPKLAAELKRTVASFQIRHPNTEITSIAAVTGDAADYAPSIESTLHQSLAVVDPSTKIASLGNSTALGAIGAGWEVLAQAPTAIDFFQPKKAPPPRYSAKRLGILGGIFAVVAMGIGIIWQQQALASLDGKISETQGEIARLESEIKSRSNDSDRHAEVSKWLASRVHWLDELNELAYRLPDTNKAFLTSLHGKVGQVDRTPVGEFDVEVRSEDPRAVMESQQRLGEKGRFLVQVKSSNTNKDAPNYIHTDSFTLRFPTASMRKPAAKGETPATRSLAKLPTDKQRVPVNLDSKKRTSTVADARSSRKSSRRDRDTTVSSPGGSSTTPSSSSSSSSESSGEQALKAKIDRLKVLPLDQLESELLKEKSLLRARLRKMVEEAKGQKS